LSTRLRRHLERTGKAAAEQLIRVPLKPSAIFQKLPPAPQLIGSRVTRDPFFGYTTTEEQKRLLLGVGDGDKRVVIGCGRATVALCAALKQSWATAKRSSAIFNVQIQHPRVALDLFDAVIVPRHDFHGNSAALTERPANLHLTYGTVCSVDHDVVRQAGEAWQSVLGGYSNKTTCIAWLIGGPCRGFAFSEKDANDMVDQVLQLVVQRRPSVSLLVTFSRRTPLQVRVLIST
jgi:mitochondrial fission protein ELM1